MEDERALVIDNGSANLSAGFASHYNPRSVFPTVIARPHAGKKLPNGKDFEVGDEAISVRGLCDLQWPIKNGFVEDWDAMNLIWQHTFYRELRIDPEEHPVLMTAAPLTPSADREKMAQVLFETFNIPALHVANTAELALQSYGPMRLMVDVGHQCTRIVPIVHGQAHSHSTKILPIGGDTVLDSLLGFLGERGLVSNDGPNRVSAMKFVYGDAMKQAFVALDFAAESAKTHTSSYALPDGTTVTLGNELFKASEILFQPQLANIANTPSLAELLVKAATRAEKNGKEEDIKKSLLSNIYLSGGGSMLKGLQERLQKELSLILPADTKVKVSAPSERRFATWIGGQVVCMQGNLKDKWFTKEEFDEHGANYVNTKCRHVF